MDFSCEFWCGFRIVPDLSSAMVGMLMSSGPVYTYPDIFENGDLFSVFEKNPRPQEYNTAPFLKI